jgi:hypothetical protein
LKSQPVTFDTLGRDEFGHYREVTLQ